jgi:hypothetical protein
MDQNPYRSPKLGAIGEAGEAARFPRLKQAAWLAICFYPIFPFASVLFCFWLEGGPQPSGTRVGALSSFREVVATLSATMLLGIPLLAPLGFVFAFFPPQLPAKRPSTGRVLYPTLVVVLWMTLATLVYLDPGQIIKWYLD